MPTQQNLAVPIAIVIAGVFIAVALFFSGQSAAPRAAGDAAAGGAAEALQAIPAVSDSDHVLGNPDADVVVVEYSDFECPFCKQYHVTMHQIIDEYGKDGRVAWVYRHFPLTQLHPKAPKEAEAFECAFEQGGNTAFWAYADRFFEVTPSNNQTDIGTVLPQIAGEIGLDVAAFNACLSSGKYAGKVAAEFNDAVAGGGQGTPFNVLIIKGGQRVAIPGAYPYSDMRNIIETALSE